MTLNQQSLREFLMRVPGEHKVWLRFKSEPKLRAKNAEGEKRSFDNVLKIAVYTGVIGKMHRQAEIEQVEKLGTGYELPVAQARKWGHRIENTPLIEHKGQHYLETTEVEESRIEWWIGDMVVSEKVMEPWLYDKQEIVSKRDFNLEGIMEIQIDDLPKIKVTG